MDKFMKIRENPATGPNTAIPKRNHLNEAAEGNFFDTYKEHSKEA
jgi:hypothetical protein